MIIVVMGVCGSGKSRIGKALADSKGWEFLDADDYHPAANLRKMQAGLPLDDRDRLPWLQKLAEILAQAQEQGRSLVLACSALKESYRRQLAWGAPYQLIYLSGSRELLAQRLQDRSGHFMAASLLDSQLEALEIPQAAFTVPIDLTPTQQVARITAAMDSFGAKHFHYPEKSL